MARLYFFLLLLACVLTSCQGSRPAFYFGSRPAPPPDTLVATASGPAGSGLDAAASDPAPTPPARPAATPAGSLRPALPSCPRTVPLISRRTVRQPHAATARPRLQPRRSQQHAAAARQPRSDSGSLGLFLLVLLLIFLISKFPVVTLIVLGVLVLAVLIFLLVLGSGHWSYG